MMMPMVIMYCFKHDKSVTASVLRGFKQYTIGCKILIFYPICKIFAAFCFLCWALSKNVNCMFTLKLEIVTELPT